MGFRYLVYQDSLNVSVPDDTATVSCSMAKSLGIFAVRILFRDQPSTCASTWTDIWPRSRLAYMATTYLRRCTDPAVALVSLTWSA